MMSGGSYSLYRNPFPVSKEWAESPWQGQALYDIVRDQRLFADSLEAYGPAYGQTGGTHQSALGTER